MQKLTDVGENVVNNITTRFALSRNTLVHMLVTVNNGGSITLFNRPELGGSRQWGTIAVNKLPLILGQETAPATQNNFVEQKKEASFVSEPCSVETY